MGHPCDLALLTVEDDEFWSDLPSEPLELADIPHLQDEVALGPYYMVASTMLLTSLHYYYPLYFTGPIILITPNSHANLL